MIKTANLSKLAATLLSTLGDTYTVNGDACSPYFDLVLDTRTQAAIAVSLIDERANLPRKEWGYAMHVVDDINGEPCEFFHDSGNPGTPQEIVQAMLEEVLMDTAPIRINAARLPTIAEWEQVVKAVNGKKTFCIGTISFPGARTRTRTALHSVLPGEASALETTAILTTHIVVAAWGSGPFLRVRGSVVYPMAPSSRQWPHCS